MKTIEKQVKEAFNKKIYLLGIDAGGKYFWLEAPSWDCSHYWGFGYIERYSNNKQPQLAKDIISHTHFKGEIIGQQQEYDTKKRCLVNTKYTHHLNEHKLQASVLTDDESWKLSELMYSFYKLKDAADFFDNGNSNFTDNPLKEKLQNKKLAKRINEKLLPMIFKEIDILLSP